jgi:acyl carrier protein
MSEIKIDIKEKVQKVLHETFEIELDKLENDQLAFQDLGLDSLDIADMIVALEQETGKQIKITAFLGVKTMEDVYKVVSKHS